ncbi:Macrocin-O-methyltransferase (TylF) [Anatilimnocola aggregata]|uniref:Macrocin-O-methyltransferase (TylF) n=1 Tax=Anatilimnocola aggregata TaxID=2528021 RepID=A0A517YLN3_9BACT|nr:TylF/MycF/NovP-related O-methyltransferase [Anatilimnocola aggregata]QDU31131.1 Macrocin-O-methyltransferase (TylF) [Anatilimnocola aggregata]
MSKLSTFIRKLTGGRWPQSRKHSGPRFGDWQKLGHSVDRRTDGQAVRSAHDLRIEHVWDSPEYANRIDHLYHSFQLIPAEGHILECGVYRGQSINWLGLWAANRTDPRVFGFDSFEGLPHDWVMGKNGETREANCFALPALPEVIENVHLIRGWFDATFVPWKQQHSGPIALLHNDSDLYSSTALTLRTFNDRLIPGSVIVFDELCDWKKSGVYDNWAEGEWKALLEWMSEFNRTIRVISRHADFAATIQIVS